MSSNYFCLVLLEMSPFLTREANLPCLSVGQICSLNSCAILSAAATSSPSYISEQIVYCEVNNIFVDKGVITLGHSTDLAESSVILSVAVIKSSPIYQNKMANNLKCVLPMLEYSIVSVIINNIISK